MKKIEFNTRSEDGSVNHRKGYLVSLPDYAPYLFGMYKAENVINSDKRWIVVELSTGFAIGGNNWQKGQTRPKAIAEVKELLGRVGYLSLQEHVQKGLDKWTVTGKLNEDIAA